MAAGQRGKLRRSQRIELNLQSGFLSLHLSAQGQGEEGDGQLCGEPRMKCSMAEALLQIHLRLNCGLGTRVFRRELIFDVDAARMG